ncbi:DUF6183 family protein [Streptomyces sp. NPDC051636]|uniref:DUF6183 family protein n=1 Tax=Streptomyces sp. NPDC051636 TaxID=3365663 RepID=UPI0037B0BF0A
MSDNHMTSGDGAGSRPLWERSGPELEQLAGSRPEELYEAAERLCRETADAGPGGVPVLRAVGRITEALAGTRSRECSRFAADIAGRLLPPTDAGGEESVRLLRSVAEKLAKTQQPRDVAPLFDAPPDHLGDPAVELRACLLGELALTGAGRGRPALDAYAERLRELGHPLARLPGTRLDIEHRFGVRVRGLGPVKTTAQLRSRFPEVPPSDTGAAAGRTAVETPDGDRTRAAAGPFTAGGWARTPEARFFSLPRPLDPGDFGFSFLRELPLECLAGEGTRRGASVACRTTPDDVLGELFSAARNGGVNGGAQGGAYGRLYAWDSLYALLGLPADVPFLEAARHAVDHRWLRFMAFTDWFRHDTADLGLAVLDPSGTRAAVLAATDTDQV